MSIPPRYIPLFFLRLGLISIQHPASSSDHVPATKWARVVDKGRAGQRRWLAARTVLLRVRARINAHSWASRRPYGKAREVNNIWIYDRRATQPDGMDRRPRMGSYFRPGPKIAFPTGTTWFEPMLDAECLLQLKWPLLLQHAVNLRNRHVDRSFELGDGFVGFGAQLGQAGSLDPGGAV